jgi:hypothetical protein
MSTESTPNHLDQLAENVRLASTHAEKCKLLHMSNIWWMADDMLRFGVFGLVGQAGDGRKQIGEGLKRLWVGIFKHMHHVNDDLRFNRFPERFQGPKRHVTRGELRKLTGVREYQITRPLRQLEEMGVIVRKHIFDAASKVTELFITLVPEKVVELMQKVEAARRSRKASGVKKVKVRKALKPEEKEEISESGVRDTRSFNPSLQDCAGSASPCLGSGKEKIFPSKAGEYLPEQDREAKPRQTIDLSVLPETIEVDLRTGKPTTAPETKPAVPVLDLCNSYREPESSVVAYYPADVVDMSEFVRHKLFDSSTEITEKDLRRILSLSRNAREDLRMTPERLEEFRHERDDQAGQVWQLQVTKDVLLKKWPLIVAYLNASRLLKPFGEAEDTLSDVDHAPALLDMMIENIDHNDLPDTWENPGLANYVALADYVGGARRAIRAGAGAFGQFCAAMKETTGKMRSLLERNVALFYGLFDYLPASLTNALSETAQRALRTFREHLAWCRSMVNQGNRLGCDLISHGII